MKRSILLSALLILCIALQGQVRKSGVHFPFRNVHITLSNNFVTTSHPYSPWKISSPVDEHFTVYGKEAVISIVETGDTVWVPDYSGFVYADSSSVLDIKKLQARVIKNDSIISNWTPVTQLPSFSENEAVYKNNKSVHPLAYWLLKENMLNGDSLLLQLRADNFTMTLHLLKKEGDTQPFLMQIAQDTSREAISNYNMVNESFYDDSPGKGLALNHMLMAEHTNLTLFFRKHPGLEYRLQGGPFKATTGIITVANLRQGTNYKLEIRFKAHPEQSSVYTFYVAPAWYNTLWFKLLIISLLIIIIFSIGIVRARRKAARYQLEIKALYAQMNPHFLFNALSSIQGLMNDAQIEKANHYLNGFASLLRSTILMGNKETIPLSTELKNLQNYIQLEKLRFDFQYIYNQSLPSDDIEVPPLLAQPLIENAVKHGISGMREKGKLILSIYKERTDLIISVLDNGKGFDPSVTSSGYGIKLTKERIALYNKMHKTISLQMHFSDEGTEMILRFKNWLHYD